jgi:hypothetical protein
MSAEEMEVGSRNAEVGKKEVEKVRRCENGKYLKVEGGNTEGEKMRR